MMGVSSARQVTRPPLIHIWAASLVLAAAWVPVACSSSETPGPSGSSGPAEMSEASEAEQVLTDVGEIAAFAGTGASGFEGDGGRAAQAKIHAPSGVALDDQGNLYISGDHRIRKVDAATGVISTIAGTGSNKDFGDDGPAVDAGFNEPRGLAVDKGGNVYISDFANNRVRKIEASTGIITTVAGGGLGNPRTQQIGDGGPATEALVKEPLDVAVDNHGNLFIVTKHRLRKVDSAGVISSVAGTGSRALSGDGGPAGGAGLAEPEGVAVDANDNIYIADSDNHRVRRIDGATGVITTLAGQGEFHKRTGNTLYDFTRAGTGGGYAGDGGPATSAKLRLPGAVAIDPHGNVFIVDGSNRVRKVDVSTGIITTVASSATRSSGETGKVSVRTTTLGTLVGIAADSGGTLFLADFKNNRVHKVEAR